MERTSHDDAAPLTPDQIDQYLRGGSSAEESRRIVAYFAATPGVEQYHRALHGALSGGDVGEGNPVRSFDQLAERLFEKKDSAVTRPDTRGSSRGTWGRWGAIVASAAVIVGVVAITRSKQHTVADVLSERTYRTATAQRAVVTFPDGSRATLAPQTTLTVAYGASGTRTVTLTGEAYFDVRNAANGPFLVKSGSVTTRVLGTEFLVSHYPTDSRVRVAVRSGRVLVSAQSVTHPSVVVPAGRVGEVTDSTATVVVTDDDAQYTGWLTDRLVFRKAPAKEVLATLSRWYGYQFRLADSAIAARRLTAGVSTQSSTAALSTIKLLLDVDMQFDGDIVTLTPRHGRAASPGTRRELRDDFTPHGKSEVGR